MWHVFVPIVAASVFVMYLLSATSILVFGARGPSQEVGVVIPLGTDAAIRAGAPPPDIPRNVEYHQGDTLVLDNRDVVTHRLGTWYVGPRQTLEVVLSEATGGPWSCSFHPAKQINIEVRSRVDLRIALIPAFVLGIPTGLAISGATFVARRLDE